MRSLGGLLFFVLLVFATLVSSANVDLVARQGTTSSSTSSSSSSTSSTSSSTTSTTTTTSDTSTSTTTSTSTSTSTSTTTSSTTDSTRPTSTPAPAPSTSDQVTIISGVETTITVTNSNTSTSSSASPSKTPTNSNDDSDDTGIGAGSIIGLSVAGGVAVIGIIGFFVWKFTRKRFTDLDGDEAIKWPDLQNEHSGGHALPVNNTGRAGFDAGSDGELSRVASTNNYSTTDFNSGVHDPYAVPPLPHLNPNQPYRDDPSHGGAYYDPYHGPVPGTLDQPGPGGQWSGGAEAIPMTQMGGGMPGGGRMSPGPHSAYGGSEHHGEAGRQSPGPYGAYGGRGSPGPGPAYYGGR